MPVTTYPYLGGEGSIAGAAWQALAQAMQLNLNYLETFIGGMEPTIINGLLAVIPPPVWSWRTNHGEPLVTRIDAVRAALGFAAFEWPFSASALEEDARWISVADLNTLARAVGVAGARAAVPDAIGRAIGFDDGVRTAGILDTAIALREGLIDGNVNYYYDGYTRWRSTPIRESTYDPETGTYQDTIIGYKGAPAGPRDLQENQWNVLPLRAFNLIDSTASEWRGEKIENGLYCYVHRAVARGVSKVIFLSVEQPLSVSDDAVYTYCYGLMPNPKGVRGAACMTEIAGAPNVGDVVLNTHASVRPTLYVEGTSGGNTHEPNGNFGCVVSAARHYELSDAVLLDEALSPEIAALTTIENREAFTQRIRANLLNADRFEISENAVTEQAHPTVCAYFVNASTRAITRTEYSSAMGSASRVLPYAAAMGQSVFCGLQPQKDWSSLPSLERQEEPAPLQEYTIKYDTPYNNGMQYEREICYAEFFYSPPTVWVTASR